MHEERTFPMSGRRSDPSHRRHDDEPSYSLDELTSAAGVTVRTVRYYIAEGLLPPPVGGGPRSRYTRDHLDRLRLIGRLKDAFMPLKEIRRRLQSMSDEEIQEAAGETDAGPPAPLASPPGDAATDAAADAAGYIGRVLRESAPPRYAAERAVAAQMLPRAQSWRRIEITDDAELLVTEDAWDRRGDQVDAAVDWLRRILNER
jgi:DNA-binding transcriptional MerR regulator